MDLFWIKDTKTNKIVKKGFNDKKSAKAYRNSKNEDANQKERFVVTWGLDHIKRTGYDIGDD